MACIEESPYPLSFPVSQASADHFPGPAPQPDKIEIRTYARSLAGMQKEAIVSSSTGSSWRMVCDEGPYLNGTDLAPFPLAFFTCGMASSFMSEILAILKAGNIAFNNIKLTQDNLYSMEGSAIKGTMTGSALPVNLSLEMESDCCAQDIREILMKAVAASPASALLRNSLTSEFTITCNGEKLEPFRVSPLCEPVPEAPSKFDELKPSEKDFPNDIIIKCQSADTIFGVEGGAGSSLQSEQKRTLHIRGICTLLENGLKHIQVQLFKPIGSMFEFLSDDSEIFQGQSRAPSGLDYLSAGLAFCYMTQIGRYVSIVKKNLESYRIIQDTGFSLPGVSGATNSMAMAEIVKTHVYLLTSEDSDFARQLVDMSEQTCFLHAACRDNTLVKIK